MVGDCWGNWRVFSVITTKRIHYCGELLTCSFCGEVEPVLNTWNWNTRRAYRHLRYYSGPRTQLHQFQMMFWFIILWLFWKGEQQRSVLLSYLLFKVWLVFPGSVFLLLWCTYKNWVKDCCVWRDMADFPSCEFAL